jgi:hypothetical protein
MELKNIYSAFVQAQIGFAPALKTSTNPHFKSKYADLAACVEAVIDSLNDNGIGLVQKTHQDDKGITVETVFVHTSGESFSGGTLHVPAAKHDPQGFGSALSYARRYSLMAACGIAPEDDDGQAATKAVNKIKAEAKAPASDDMSPRARAMRIVAGVAAGDAAGAAEYLATLDQSALEAIWQHLDAPTAEKLTAAWPKETA